MNSNAAIDPVATPLPRPRKTPFIIGAGFITFAILALLLMPVRPSVTGNTPYEQAQTLFVWVNIVTILSTISLFIGLFVILFKLLPASWRMGRDLTTLVVAYVLTGYWYLWCLAISNGANAFVALPEILFRGFPAMLNHALKWPIGLLSGLG